MAKSTKNTSLDLSTVADSGRAKMKPTEKATGRGRVQRRRPSLRTQQ